MLDGICNLICSLIPYICMHTYKTCFIFLYSTQLMTHSTKHAAHVTQH